MRHLRNPSILVVSLTGAVLLGSSPVSAEVSMAVSPALLELKAGAGDQGRVEVNVSNSGDEAFEVLTAILPFQDMTGDRSAVEWSTVSPERLLLEPGDHRSALYTVDIPGEVAAGGRYAQIAFTTVPPGSDETTAVAGRILVPVLITVDGQGDPVRSPALDRAAVFLEPDGRLGARVAVRNDGSVHVPLTGSVELSTGSPAGDTHLGIPMGRVLPGTTRTYSSDATTPLPLGSTYDVVVVMGLPDETEALRDPLFREAFHVEATPVFELGVLTVCENPDRGPTLSATLVNDGALGIAPLVGFQVFDATGARTGAAPAVGQPLAWPHSTTDATADLVDVMPAGTYTLVASARFGLESWVDARRPFTIGGDPLTAAPLCAAVTPAPSATP